MFLRIHRDIKTTSKTHRYATEPFFSSSFFCNMWAHSLSDKIDDKNIILSVFHHVKYVFVVSRYRDTELHFFPFSSPLV